MTSARCFICAETGFSTAIEAMPMKSAMPTGGSRNCQTETPAALATISSSRRVRSMKAVIVPKSTQNGSTCSATDGVRKNERKATKSSGDARVIARPAQHFDEIDDIDHAADGQEDHHDRVEKPHRQIAGEGGADHVSLPSSRCGEAKSEKSMVQTCVTVPALC